MNYTYGVTNTYSECQDCEFKATKKNAQAISAIHAKKYGHHVMGEMIVKYEYGLSDDV